MNLNQLEYLAALAHCDSYAKASKQVCMTPQAVSKSIKAFESELGIPIAISERGETRLTDFGKEAAEQAELALDAITKIKVAAKERQQAPISELRIALSDFGDRGSLYKPEEFERFVTKYPDIKLSFMHYPPETCLSSLIQGEADIAIVPGRNANPKLEYRKAFEEPILFAFDKEKNADLNKAFSIKKLSGKTLALPLDLSYCRQTLSDYFASHDIKVAFESIAQSRDACLGFLKKGGVVAVFKSSKIANLKGDVRLAKPHELEQIVFPFYSVRDASRATKEGSAFLDFAQSLNH